MFLQERIEEINRDLRILETASNVAVWGAGVHTAKLFEKTELLSFNTGCYILCCSFPKYGLKS